MTNDEMGYVLLAPRALNDIHDVGQIALGDAHTLFLTRTGQVYSSGWHELGQLGISSEQLENAQTGVHLVDIKSELTFESLKVRQISCGAVFSVALTVTNEIYAWGSNNNGQMGISTEAS